MYVSNQKYKETFAFSTPVPLTIGKSSLLEEPHALLVSDLSSSRPSEFCFSFKHLLLDLFIWMYVCFACMIICSPCVSLVPMEVRRGHQIPLELELDLGVV